MLVGDFTERLSKVIVLVDMDCFYVQVEQRLNPSLLGKPCAVCQYQQGGLLAVSYEARALGVSRRLKKNEALKICPQLQIAAVPELRGKADLRRYRDASAEVMAVLASFGGILERASIDEAYLDLTEIIKDEDEVSDAGLDNSFVIGFPKQKSTEQDKEVERQAGIQDCITGLNQVEEYKNDKKLLIAAKLVEEIRTAVYEKTRFRCSAGIAHNKMFAKFACGVNKPNKQTILPFSSVHAVLSSTHLTQFRKLGGKLGIQIQERLGMEYLSQITEIPWPKLFGILGSKVAIWIFWACRGLDEEPVVNRTVVNSIGAGKNFPGDAALSKVKVVEKWVKSLCEELVDRLVRDEEDNKRKFQLVTISIGNSTTDHVTRTCSLDKYELENMSAAILSKINFLNESKIKEDWSPPITSLQISANKPMSCVKQKEKIEGFLVKRSAAELLAEKPSTNSGNFSNVIKSENCDFVGKRQKITSFFDANQKTNSSTEPSTASNCIDLDYRHEEKHEDSSPSDDVTVVSDLSKKPCSKVASSKTCYEFSPKFGASNFLSSFKQSRIKTETRLKSKSKNCRMKNSLQRYFKLQESYLASSNNLLVLPNPSSSPIVIDDSEDDCE